MPRKNHKHCFFFILFLFAGLLSRAQEVRFVLKPNEFRIQEDLQGYFNTTFLPFRDNTFIALGVNTEEYISRIKLAIIRVNSVKSENRFPELHVERTIHIDPLISANQKSYRHNSKTSIFNPGKNRWTGQLLGISQDGKLLAFTLRKGGKSAWLYILNLKNESIEYSKLFVSEKNRNCEIIQGIFVNSVFRFQLWELSLFVNRIRQFEYDLKNENLRETTFSGDFLETMVRKTNQFSLKSLPVQMEVPEIHCRISRTDSGLKFSSLQNRYPDFHIITDSVSILEDHFDWQWHSFVLYKNKSIVRHLRFNTGNGDVFISKDLILSVKKGLQDYYESQKRNTIFIWDWNKFINLKDYLITYQSFFWNNWIKFRIDQYRKGNNSGNIILGDSLIHEGLSRFYAGGNKHIELFSKKRQNCGFFVRHESKLLEYDFDNRKVIARQGSEGTEEEMVHPIRDHSNLQLSLDSSGFACWFRRMKTDWPYVKLKLNGKKIFWIYPVFYELQRGKEIFSPFREHFRTDISRKGEQIFIRKRNTVIAYNQKGKARPAWTADFSARVLGLKLSYNQEFLAVWQADGVMSLLNAANGKQFLSAYVDTSNMNWVMWTPSGYYDCSPQGEKLIGWSMSRGKDSLPVSYPAAMFRSRFYRPDLIDSVLKFHSEEQALKSLSLEGGASATKSITECQPPVVYLTKPDNNSFFSDSSISLSYELKPGSSPVQEMRVFVNGRPTKTIVPERGNQVIQVKVPGQNCTVGISAVSACGESEMVYSSLYWRGENRSITGIRKPDLYILGIGISRYKNPGLRLGLPAKDAKDFCQFFQNQKNGLYGSVNVRLLTDSLASREAIQQGLEWLEKNAGPKDVSMIFLAGHGENDRNNVFYFLPWEANPESMKSNSVPYYDFKNTVSALPGKVIFFADACRSGNIFGDLVQRSVNIDVLARELASGNGGSVVFTSSGRKQASLENVAWGNGAFTKALLEGLEGKADIFNDGFISVKGLDVFISRRVREITENRQIPNTIIPESIPDFVIAVKSKIEK
jgi:hypothetical protein